MNILELEYREYQRNIAQQCVLKNSLVVLPTGLGKTIIALYVAVKTLEKYPSDNKIIVLAPTRPLINQHYDMFLRYLNIPKEKFKVLTGKIIPEKRATLFHENQLLFYTPQTLRNDLVSKRYSLEDVCLIVFDEAHHASGDFPYGLISDTYMEQNPDGSILALTASPGASKTKINDLCTTLHIPFDNIHTRTRMDVDVKTYLKPMDIYKIGVNMTRLMEENYEGILTLLEERLQYLSQFNFLDAKSEKLMEKIIRKDLLKLNSELISLLKQEGDKTGIYTALSVNAQALILFHMIELIEQQGLDVLLIYLEKVKSDARKQSSSKAIKILAADHRLQQLYLELKRNEEFSSENLIHPKYGLLKKVILEEIENNPKARILVFVKLRDSVKIIVNKLKKHPSILPARFVGQASKSVDDIGLSQKKQLEILERFKSGEINTLISTNVGEEGLDIAECDLVIFYDVVASEIRFIQRKGRTARHREGKVIILYCKGTKDEIYLRIALLKLQKMNVNLKNKHLTAHNIPLFSNYTETEEDVISDTVDNEINPSSDQNPISSSRKTQTTLQSFLTHLNVNENTSEKKSDISISKELPVKFGIRSKLQDDHISFMLSSTKNHIVLFESILIHIYHPRDFTEETSSITIQRILILSRKFELILNIVDFVDFEESYMGEENLLKSKLHNLGKINGIQLIPVDNIEELYFILKNIYIYNKKQGGI